MMMKNIFEMPSVGQGRHFLPMNGTYFSDFYSYFRHVILKYNISM